MEGDTGADGEEGDDGDGGTEAVGALAGMAAAAPITAAQWRVEQEADPRLSRFVGGRDAGVVLEGGVWVRRAVVEGQQRRQVVVPWDRRATVMNVVHEAPTGGHAGQRRTWERVRAAYWWPAGEVDGRRRTMREQVVRYVKQCVACAARKRAPPRQVPLGSVPSLGAGHTLGVDLMTNLPGKYAYALVMTDLATKWAAVAALKDKCASTVARKLVKAWYTQNGPPRAMLSDRGSEFLGAAVREMNALFGVHGKRTTAYNPSTNGQTERMNKTVCDMLSHYVRDRGADWHEYAAVVATTYNSTRHSVTGFTPAFLRGGFDFDDPLRATLHPAAPPLATAEARDVRERITAAVKAARAAAGAANVAEQTRRSARAVAGPGRVLDLKAGQKVMLLHDHQRGGSKKFVRRWTGPHELARKVSDQVYEIRRASDAAGGVVTEKVNAKRLKLYEPPATGDIAARVHWEPVLGDGDDDGDVDDEHEVREITDVRVDEDATTKARRFMYRVRWENFPASAATWEPAANVANAEERVAEFWASRGLAKPPTVNAWVAQHGYTVERRRDGG